MSQLTKLEEASWRGFLRTHDTLWKTLESIMAKDSGLTLSAYEVLLLLEEAGPQGSRMTQLAQTLGFSGGGLTRLADKLQQEGYLERRRCDADGRGFEALLTPAGRVKLKRVHVKHLRAVRSLFLQRLTEEEQTALAAIWKKLGHTGQSSLAENVEENHE
jgi:DNA-binding MarR family transcriptional regulator